MAKRFYLLCGSIKAIHMCGLCTNLWNRSADSKTYKASITETKGG